MKALITGCCGFVGSHLCDLLVSKGWEVIGIDDFSSNVVEEIPGMLIKKRMEDVSLDEIPKIDYVFHLADRVGPLTVMAFAGTMAESTIEHARWAIDLALRDDALLVSISTSEIYGAVEGRLYLKEDDAKVFQGSWTPRSEYAAGKMLAEMMIVSTSKVKPLRFQIIRPFNICGERQKEQGGFVLPRFVRQAKNEEDITVYIPGTQRRSFSYVGDVVSAILMIAQKGKENEIWNVGNKNNETTILELAERVKALSKTKSKIVIVDPKMLWGPNFAEAPDKVCNSEKLESLGWKPLVGIDEAIKKIL